MRVLYLLPAAAFGGAERQASYHIDRLPEHGIEVVPVVGPGQPILDALAELGVTDVIARRDMPADQKAPRSLLRRCALLYEYARSVRRLSRDLVDVARDRRCDLIFASRPFAWVVASSLGRSLGLPVVWRAGTMFEHWAQPAALGLLGRLAPPRGVVYTSHAVRDVVGARLHAPGFVLHNGVDTQRFSVAAAVAARRAQPNLRHELGIAPDAPVVAVVGRLSPEKGLGLLVELAQRLVADQPDVQVLVAGDSGWRERFEAAVREAHLEGTLRRLGFVRDVAEVYAAADVVLQPSLSEGCPNAVLEAMAMGRPVVATRVGGTPEILRDGIDGLLVAPGDSSSMARRIGGLLAEPLLREELGRAAAARVLERYTIDAQVHKLADVLRWAARVPLAQRRRREAA